MARRVAPIGETRARVKDLSEKGLGLRAISATLGISTQAVHYHLTRLRRENGRKAS